MNNQLKEYREKLNLTMNQAALRSNMLFRRYKLFEDSSYDEMMSKIKYFEMCRISETLKVDVDTLFHTKSYNDNQLYHPNK